MSAVVEVLSTSSDEDEVFVPNPPALNRGSTHPATVPSTAADANTAAPADTVGDDASDEGFVDVAECDRLKRCGNALFGEGRVDEALAEYRKAIACAPIKPIQRPKPSASAAFDDETGDADAGSADVAGEGAGGGASTTQEDGDPAKEAADTTDYTLTSQVFCNAGYCLMKLELYDEAVDLLSEAIRHNTEYQKAYLRRADSYYKLEKWSSAYGDYESYVKLGGALDSGARGRRDVAKTKTDEEMKKMLGDLKDLGNRFLSNFGLSTDMFKFDKDPATGGYSMRFERE